MQTTAGNFHILLPDEFIADVRVEAENAKHRIFMQAMNSMNAQPETTLVVGDNFEFDISPCLDLGCQGVLSIEFNDVPLRHQIPAQVPVINKLDHLQNILST